MKISQPLLMTVMLTLAFAAPSRAEAANLFVNKQGNDTSAGTSREQAFLTITRGVAALQPGDVLSIGPGEYHEAIERNDLGSTDRETVIRAEIPGTVLLRGDAPAPKFSLVSGTQFTYVADFPFQGQVPVMNEIDTLSILGRMPNSSELEFIPGTFYHDAGAKKLYVSSSDMKPIDAHRYSVSVIPKNGIYFARPKRVVIEGLAFTGFNSMEVIHYSKGTAGGTWGLFLLSSTGCTIRDCLAYLNGWGIGINSSDKDSGGNVIERCTAWGNNSQFANGDMGGITIFAARRDAIRNSTAYLNGMYGVNIYGTGGAPPGLDDGGNVPEKKSLLSRNFAWGNQVADLKIKTGYEYFHIVDHCTAKGSCHSTNVVASLLGRDNHAVGLPASARHPTNDILLNEETELDPRAEFADPDNHDYRLQATSRFRKSGPKGEDRGPTPYVANIFYVKPDGDDAADGLSTGKAWKTLARGVKDLKAGDTLYLEPGRYAGGFELRSQGAVDAPIAIRGRGIGAVLIDGGLSLHNSSGLRFERLQIDGTVKIEKGTDVGFRNCTFTAKDSTVRADGVRDLVVEHCRLIGFTEAALKLTGCTSVRLSGNDFDNAAGSALKLDGKTGIAYSDYNSYRHGITAWEVDGTRLAWSDVRKAHEQHSQELATSVDTTHGPMFFKNPELFTAAGPFGKSIGPYRDEAYRRELKLINKPKVHSVSATTANLEWTTSLPATCQIAWGETPACEKKDKYDVNHFGTFSLLGLKPATKYYFRLKSLSIPTELVAKYDAPPVELADDIVEFTTATIDAPPTTYYVAVDGNDADTGLSRAAAFKTIRRAAAKVNVGDTVLIAGGKYTERVRIRATGAKGAPITFRAIPGERVEMDGATQALNNAFAAGRKSHLRFDGFYLAGFNMFPDSRWPLGRGAEFHLYEGSDIEISRCFSDGRGGYSAESINAYYIDNLTISNCVNTNKMGGALYVWRCPNLMVRNNVFAAPMIFAFVLRNTKTQPSTMDDNVFTDMFDKKARLNIPLLCVDGDTDAFRHHNNCYLLRTVIPLQERAMLGTQTISQLGNHLIDPLFADPQFAGDPGPPPNPEPNPRIAPFAPDRLMNPQMKLDFDSFFATNPEVVKRGIGLQPDAFKDFRFQTKTK